MLHAAEASPVSSEEGGLIRGKKNRGEDETLKQKTASSALDIPAKSGLMRGDRSCISLRKGI